VLYNKNIGSTVHINSHIKLDENNHNVYVYRYCTHAPGGGKWRIMYFTLELGFSYPVINTISCIFGATADELLYQRSTEQIQRITDFENKIKIAAEINQ